MAFQELAHLTDDAVVLLLRLVSRTGSHTSLDLEFDARALGRPIDVDRTGRQWKHLFDDFQGLSEGARRRIRAIVQGAVLLDAPHDREPRETVLDWKAKVRILLVVPQNDIEAGPVPFDQVALKNQGFQF